MEEQIEKDLKYEPYEIHSVSNNEKLEIQLDEPKEDGKRILNVKVGKNKFKVDFDKIWAAMFLMADNEEKSSAIPVKTGRFRFMTSYVQLQLNKDMKKGEFVTAKHEVKVPEELFVTNSPSGIVKPLNKLI